MMEPRFTVAIDFDRVIHAYRHGWQDGSVYDEPIPGAFDAIVHFLDMGYGVFILSTRAPEAIKAWLDEQRAPFHSVVIDPLTTFWNANPMRLVGITRVKLPFDRLIDDRAVTFRDNWPEMMAAMDQAAGVKTLEAEKRA